MLAQLFVTSCAYFILPQVVTLTADTKYTLLYVTLTANTKDTLLYITLTADTKYTLLYVTLTSGCCSQTGSRVLAW